MRSYAQTNLQLYAELAEADRTGETVRRAHDAYLLAMRLFAARYRACGKTFISHLVGTASIVHRHGADPDTVVAGILHAAYDQGDFGNAKLPEQRAAVRAAVGETAEAIVARYSAWTARGMEEALKRAKAETLDPIDRAALLVRCCNEIEEMLDGACLMASDLRQHQISELRRQCIGYARHVGQSDLADELESAQEALAARIYLKGLADPTPASQTILPASAQFLPPPMRERARTAVVEGIATLIGGMSAKRARRFRRRFHRNNPTN